MIYGGKIFHRLFWCINKPHCTIPLGVIYNVGVQSKLLVHICESFKVQFFLLEKKKIKPRS